jgi:hypothetical protein
MLAATATCFALAAFTAAAATVAAVTASRSTTAITAPDSAEAAIIATIAAVSAIESPSTSISSHFLGRRRRPGVFWRRSWQLRTIRRANHQLRGLFGCCRGTEPN